jgi:hypothetical protein
VDDFNTGADVSERKTRRFSGCKDLQKLVANWFLSNKYWLIIYWIFFKLFSVFFFVIFSARQNGKQPRNE